MAGRYVATWRNVGDGGAMAAYNRGAESASRQITEGISGIGSAFTAAGKQRAEDNTTSVLALINAASTREESKKVADDLIDSGIDYDSAALTKAFQNKDATLLASENVEYGKEQDILTKTRYDEKFKYEEEKDITDQKFKKTKFDFEKGRIEKQDTRTAFVDDAVNKFFSSNIDPTSDTTSAVDTLGRANKLRTTIGGKEGEDVFNKIIGISGIGANTKQQAIDVDNITAKNNFIEQLEVGSVSGESDYDFISKAIEDGVNSSHGVPKSTFIAVAPEVYVNAVDTDFMGKFGETVTGLENITAKMTEKGIENLSDKDLIEIRQDLVAARDQYGDMSKDIRGKLKDDQVNLNQENLITNRLTGSKSRLGIVKSQLSDIGKALNDRGVAITKSALKSADDNTKSYYTFLAKNQPGEVFTSLVGKNYASGNEAKSIEDWMNGQIESNPTFKEHPSHLVNAVKRIGVRKDSWFGKDFAFGINNKQANRIMTLALGDINRDVKSGKIPSVISIKATKDLTDQVNAQLDTIVNDKPEPVKEESKTIKLNDLTESVKSARQNLIDAGGMVTKAGKVVGFGVDPKIIKAYKDAFDKDKKANRKTKKHYSNYQEYLLGNQYAE